MRNLLHPWSRWKSRGPGWLTRTPRLTKNLTLQRELLKKEMRRGEVRSTLPGRDQAEHLEKEEAAKELFQTVLRDQADQQKGSTMIAHGNLAFMRGTSTKM